MTPAYDDADRTADTGYVFDDLGRILTVPAADAGGTDLNVSYYADDLVQGMNQGTTLVAIDRDPETRVRARTTTPEVPVVSHYGDESDDPSWTEQGSSVTRNLSDLTGDLAAVKTGSTVTLQLSDMHGDVVAEMPNSATASAPTPFMGVDEFGVRRAPALQTIATNVKTLTTDGTSASIGKPGGTAANDLLVAQIAAGADATITPPSGWTAVPGGETTGGTTRYKTFYKLAGGSEPGSYSFTFSQASKHIGAITTFRNAAQQNSIDTVAIGSGNDSNITAPSVTPTVGGAGHLVFAGKDAGDLNGGSIFSFPSLIEEWERKTGTTATDRSVGAGFRILTSGAGTPTGTMTVFNATGYGATPWGAILAIKPAYPAPQRVQAAYSYLGAKQRNTTLASGAIEMGARVYVPQLGRFLQPDPVYGGSANPYDYAFQDPINVFDLDGRCPPCLVALGMLVRAVVAIGLPWIAKKLASKAIGKVMNKPAKYLRGNSKKTIGHMRKLAEKAGWKHDDSRSSKAGGFRMYDNKGNGIRFNPGRTRTDDEHGGGRPYWVVSRPNSGPPVRVFVDE